MYFNIPACAHCSTGASTPSPAASGVHYLCGPHFELDYDRSIEEARRLFGELYADEEFLPRAPDPEEIIVAGSAEDADAMPGDALDVVAIETSVEAALCDAAAVEAAEQSADGEVAEEACA